ncbi:MAG: hypothetical protein K6T91_01340 [Firmicutes bacterium]|nr:hypothetical protein [Bacillota bacterium]
MDSGYIICPQKHYVCNDCHNKGSIEAIERVTVTTKSKDPQEIAEIMMGHPGLPMLGCQHAYIAAGALLAAIRNEGSYKIADSDIKEAFGRLDKQAIGGFCGLTGICSVAPAIGVVFSILLGSKCGMAEEQHVTMDAAARASQIIADLTGPSCCKAYVRACLSMAVGLLKDKFGLALSATNPTKPCTYVDKHPHGCRLEKCPYFGNVVRWYA